MGGGESEANGGFVNLKLDEHTPPQKERKRDRVAVLRVSAVTARSTESAKRKRERNELNYSREDDATAAAQLHSYTTRQE